MSWPVALTAAAFAAFFTACEPSRVKDDCSPASCDRCHGSDANAAPPADTNGRMDPALSTVGAHQSHLAASNWHGPMACTDCHLVPTCLLDPGHVDSSPPAELTWGDLALAGWAAPAYDAASSTCSGVYCHGATLEAGGSLTSQVWTVLDGSQDACGTCHGLPPPLPHPENASCETCHFDVYDGAAFVNPERHINGMVNF
jgi:predicted CxxxxCH...CXXCH cytochrome family protein